VNTTSDTQKTNKQNMDKPNKQQVYKDTVKIAQKNETRNT